MTESLTKIARSLKRELRKRSPEVREVSSKRITLASRPALFYSYVRTPGARSVESVAVVATRSGSFILKAVAPRGNLEIGREVADVISSFEV